MFKNWCSSWFDVQEMVFNPSLHTKYELQYIYMRLWCVLLIPKLQTYKGWWMAKVKVEVWRLLTRCWPFLFLDFVLPILILKSMDFLLLSTKILQKRYFSRWSTENWSFENANIYIRACFSCLSSCVEYQIT